jgi:predicted enzyme related to lactoylglutathione lyase
VSPDSNEEYAAVGGPRRPRDNPGWLFFQVPEGKSAKNRLHVDLEADDLDAETQRLTALAASVLWEKDEWGTRWNTLTDPEDNEFCVAQKKPPKEPDPDA